QRDPDAPPRPAAQRTPKLPNPAADNALEKPRLGTEPPIADPGVPRLCALLARRGAIAPLPEHTGPAPIHRETSPSGKACASWFRQLARALRTCRLYRPENPLVQNVRENTVDALLQHLRANGDWQLRFTPDEIRLGDERIVAAPAKN